MTLLVLLGARAAGQGTRVMTSLISLMPAVTAEKGTNAARMRSAIRYASVVLPDPGGPQSIIDGTSPRSSARARTLPSPNRCVCPTNSWRVLGRIRSARGARSLCSRLLGCSNSSITKDLLARREARMLERLGDQQTLGFAFYRPSLP